MQALKEFFGKKGAGFYVCFAAALLAFVSAFVYVAGYRESVYMSWWVFALALVAAGSFVALSVFRITRPFSPVVLGVASFAMLLMFIRTVYMYLSEVFYAGLSFESFKLIAPAFFACTILMFVCVVLCVVGLCLKQEKARKENV